MNSNSAAHALQSERVHEWFAPYLGEVNLNVGCGLNPIPGLVNITEESWPLGAGRSPIPDASVDCIIASHVMEHVADLIPAMREIHQALKPNGCFIAITPYASSDDAWEDPTHVRVFTENSWSYFDRRLYERDGHAGHYRSPVDFIFEREAVWLAPYAEFINDPDIEFKKRHYRNVIRELQVVLRAIK